MADRRIPLRSAAWLSCRQPRASPSSGTSFGSFSVRAPTTPAPDRSWCRCSGHLPASAATCVAEDDPLIARLPPRLRAPAAHDRSMPYIVSSDQPPQSSHPDTCARSSVRSTDRSNSPLNRPDSPTRKLAGHARLGRLHAPTESGATSARQGSHAAGLRRRPGRSSFSRPPHSTALPPLRRGNQPSGRGFVGARFSRCEYSLSASQARVIRSM